MRVYERKFDWDEAKRLLASGWTKKRIADHFGVSESAVFRVTKPGARERMNAQRMARQRSGSCPICGRQTTRYASDRNARCVDCFNLAQATSVREDTLQCVGCRRWLPDSAFPSNVRNKFRRSRHRQCTSCGTAEKRRWRQRHPERDRESNRRASERRRQKKAA